jgi:hypothetical protein
MVVPQFVEGVTLKPRFMVSAWLSHGAASAIMSKLRRESRPIAAPCARRRCNGCARARARPDHMESSDLDALKFKIVWSRFSAKKSVNFFENRRYEPEPVSL